MRGENSGYNKVNVKNEQLITADYSDKDSGDSDVSDDSDDHSPPLNLKKHQEA